ncbi:MAG: hypothetical protein ACFFC7_10695 [Candidatus Hermodarchaeota archaeon]
MQNPIITTILFIFGAAFIIGIPFFVLITGIVMLKSSRMTSSRLFDAGIHLLTMAAAIPAIMFLWFVPTIALIIVFLSYEQLEPSIRMVVMAFGVIGFALQIMFVRDTIKKDLQDKGLTFTQYIRRTFSREHKEQIRIERKETSKRVDELYSKIDDITARPWAKKQREMAERAKQAELESQQEQVSEAFIKKSSLITTIVSLVGTAAVIFLISAFIGLDTVLAQDSNALRALADLSFLVGVVFLGLGTLAIYGLQRSRGIGVSYGTVVAGATNTVLEQSIKDIDRWSYSRLAWVVLYIGGLLILMAIALTIVYFPGALSI